MGVVTLRRLLTLTLPVEVVMRAPGPGSRPALLGTAGSRTEPGTHAELLASVGRGRLGGIDLVRITPGGTATSRATLFDPGLVTRSLRTGVAPALARAPVGLVRLLASRWS